ncbi:Protein farnesyltransferase, alpha subunit/protein geranylgeranyltransferase type I, alpha subunit [Ceraceosorus bombacis]|uniref:Protein farnesyltransferase/geranylgeranyltransferase type-1 subunit alpha n=1 Tax=Ceraceosorus bombacis TaxID=401625 RepID=A0A0N7L9I6_9BASI|nr:Protein farnesyltransferase, alpha subunit/protein geranylgeranyltransferase type I, alpha subunit [Ceraceosorus bombacis]
MALSFDPYSEDFDAASQIWADVVPVHQDDGPNPLCPIMYSPDYSKAMDLLRALLPRGELSLRALQLTKHLATLNASSYTVWAWRAKILSADDDHSQGGLGVKEDRLRRELEWLDDLSNSISLKNYQVWQHRRQILTMQLRPDLSKELAFTAEIFKDDAKNYHTWAYRAWLVSHFGMTRVAAAEQPAATTYIDEIWNAELAFTSELIADDARNNSAWNHRWLVLFGSAWARSQGAGRYVGADLEHVVTNESNFAQSHIARMPHNQSAWTYLRGLVKLAPSSNAYAPHADLARQMLTQVRSSQEDTGAPLIECPPALEWLLDEATARLDVATALDLLYRLAKADPIRRKMWDWRGKMIQRNAAGGVGLQSGPAPARVTAS